jgi:acyl-CoA reductase-like NAD-dependent aldehyde dehydrogenase
MTETILQEAGLAGTAYATLAGTRIIKCTGTPFGGSSPVDGSPFPELLLTDAPGYDAVLTAAEQAYHAWKAVSAPVRATLAAALARALESDREPLARLITLETGKLLREAQGEVSAATAYCRRAAALAPQLKCACSTRPTPPA